MHDDKTNQIPTNSSAADNETRLKLLYEIGRILDASETIKVAAPQILEAICRHLQFEVGELWFLDKGADVLKLNSVRHPARPQLERFAAESQSFEFSVGIGLPGRVWEKNAPVWIEDLRGEKDLARSLIAERAGMRSAFAFPILLGEKFLGAFCFFCESECPHDEALMQMFVAVGGNIGQFIKRERVEGDLRQSEENFRALVKASSQAIWTTDIEGQNLEAYGWWENQTGQTRQESAGAGFLQAVHAEDRRQASDLWRTAMAHLEYFETECRIISRSGEYEHFALRGVPVFNADGSFRQWIGTLTDISDRKLAEQSQKNNEERYRALVEATSTVVWRSTPEGNLSFVGADWEKVSGQRVEEILGTGWINALHPDDREKTVKIWQRSLAAKNIYETEFRVLTTTGEYRWFAVRGVPILNADGTIREWVGANTDIHERKTAEVDLRESEDKFRNLANSISQLAWMADATGHLFWYNERWFDYTGTTLEEMQGWGWQKVHHPVEVERVTAKFRQHLVSGEIWEDTFPIRSKIGEYRWFLSRAQPIHDENRNIIRWFGTNTDITERREIEAERERLLEIEQQARESAEQANFAKDEFIALVSHELRSPLNAMLGWTRILQKKKADEKTSEYALDVIAKNALSQSRLIEDLLDIARLGKGKLRLEPAPLELLPIINAAVETIKPAAESKNIKLSQNLDRIANLITGDPDRLRQVVENLLSNAVKFTPEGGSVSVRLEREESHAKIILSDTGQGISAEFLPQIFERFKQADPSATRRHGGLGIGLSLARDLVELHGGTISAHSAGEGTGATFTVRLPLRTVRPIKEFTDKVENMDSQGKLSGFWILAVDDEADAREIISFMLQINGARVTSANSAVEALEILTNADGRIPDILLSDISMPFESGYALLEKIRALPREHGGQIPAVALTAFNRPEDREAAFEAGFQKHLGKPVDMDALIDAIVETASAKQV